MAVGVPALFAIPAGILVTLGIMLIGGAIRKDY